MKRTSVQQCRVERGQTCNDPDMSYVSQHDFVCTCDNDAALTKVDGPATCFSDECRNSPCAMGQTCNDPKPSKSQPEGLHVHM